MMGFTPLHPVSSNVKKNVSRQRPLNRDVTGFMVVIAGPTGVGETTVTEAVIRALPRAQRLITTTSRPMRPGEKQGREYYFLSNQEFRRRIRGKFFLEYILMRSRGVHYGTEREKIERALQQGKIVIANLELRGLRVMRREYPHTLALFLKPENLQQIITRKLRQHPNITKKELALRYREARRELAESKYYDAVVVNREGRLHKTVQEVIAHIRVHERQIKT